MTGESFISGKAPAQTPWMAANANSHKVRTAQSIPFAGDQGEGSRGTRGVPGVLHRT